MSKWQGKMVIGLTGNIATGKSVVRKMLEHLGAYGIDADALAHRAIARGAPAYQPVLDTFGRWILGPDQQIDRAKLGRVVFSDPEALQRLESLVHPLVMQAVDLLVRRSSQPVVVIEAVKLLETRLADSCDSLWVSTAVPEVQLARLMSDRKMTEAEARIRIQAQPAQEIKINAAQVVIRNDGTFEETWKQVQSGWKKLFPAAPTEETSPTQPVAVAVQPAVTVDATASIKEPVIAIQRGRPRHSGEIAALISRLKPGKLVTRTDIMAAFGEKAFLLLQVENQLVGVVGWQVENLVARTTDLFLDPCIPAEKALPPLLREVERASRDLQCEASLLFAPRALMQDKDLWKNLGYEPRTPQSLGVQAWQEAARESAPDGESVLLFKQLRTDRILRPI